MGQPPSSSEQTALLLQRGVALHRAGVAAEAEELYRRILAQCPDHSDALHMLGYLRFQQGRANEALQLIDQAITANPSALLPLVLRGRILHDQGLSEEAIACFDRALTIGGKFPDALIARGNVLQSLGRCDEALASFDGALARQSNNIHAWYNRGRALEQIGRLDDALVSYDRALKLDPHHFGALNNRGMTLMKLERFQDALASYDLALAAEPGHKGARNNRGNALLKVGRADEARSWFRDILLDDPRDPDLHFNLGNTLVELDLLQEAESCYLEALACLDLANPHWYGRAPRADGAMPTAHYPDALRAAVARLDAAAIPAFLIGGTLLGAIREGEFISFDRDLDFGVDEKITPSILKEAFVKDPEFRHMRGDGDDAEVASFSWRDTVAIDFFRFFSTENSVFCALRFRQHQIRWMHRAFGLVDFSWHGVTVKIPDDPERFLTEDYGDWRTPNPHFGLFASPNIEGGFPLVCRLGAYSDIFLAITGRQRERAISLCDQVLSLDKKNTLIEELRTKILTCQESFGDRPPLALHDRGFLRQGALVLAG
jgi:tetratricopeptide (TPR) repeat protein